MAAAELLTEYPPPYALLTIREIIGTVDCTTEIASWASRWIKLTAESFGEGGDAKKQELINAPTHPRTDEPAATLIYRIISFALITAVIWPISYAGKGLMLGRSEDGTLPN
ncbi:hypothetical protein M3A74_03990 [Corynebacterium appendicis]|uniref:hypothetical protein n=1 Tax=Corynebacterium appendicis TaxID=163202 RepID=UPI00223BAFAE|nr:hypothetical protein [Corynebacterium appendicis]MCT1683977.1 hypothetical protein [Corynebacterium appendicis]